MDKSKLLAKHDRSYRDVPVDVGVVRVRGLTRAEVQACDVKDEYTRDIKAITTALVDPEDMTEDEVRQWLDQAPAGDFVAVLNAVAELCGIDTETPKSGVRGVRGSGKRR